MNANMRTNFEVQCAVIIAVQFPYFFFAYMCVTALNKRSVAMADAEKEHLLLKGLYKGLSRLKST